MFPFPFLFIAAGARCRNLGGIDAGTWLLAAALAIGLFAVAWLTD